MHIDLLHVVAMLPFGEHGPEFHRLQSGPHQTTQRHFRRRRRRVGHIDAVASDIIRQLVFGTPVRQARFHDGSALGLPAHFAGTIVAAFRTLL